MKSNSSAACTGVARDQAASNWGKQWSLVGWKRWWYSSRVKKLSWSVRDKKFMLNDKGGEGGAVNERN